MEKFGSGINILRNTDSKWEKVSFSYSPPYADQEKRPVLHVASPDLSVSPSGFSVPWKPIIKPNAQN
jgi:hypothetical protein